MPLSRNQKKKIIDDLQKELRKSKFIVLVDFKGLKAQDMYGLREKLKSVGSTLRVTKKTLFNIAGKNENLIFNEEKSKLLENTQPAIIFSPVDEILPSKTVYQFGLQNKNIKILGGYLKNEESQYEFVSRDDVISLAQLPSKEELWQRLVGTISSPLRQFVNALQGNIKGLIISLNNIKSNQAI